NADLQLPQPVGTLLPPHIKVAVHAGDERGKLGMLVDCVFDRCLVHGEREIAGTVHREQCLSKLRADGPVVLEGVDITGGDAAFEVAVDVLAVFRTSTATSK